MVNKELLMILSMSLSGFLGALGGLRFKPFRRFILPFCLGTICFLAGFIWWRSFVIWSGLTIAFCMPYGQKTPYPVKFLVGCAFVSPTFVLGFSWWQIFTPIAFIIMFRLSNTKLAGKIFKWKIVEFLVFALVGITIASLISK